MRLSTSLSAVTAFCFLASAPFASATVINTLQLSASSGGGSITVTTNTISFTPGLGNCGANPCDAGVNPGSTMTYNGGILVNGTYNAFIGNLVFSPPSVPNPFIAVYTGGGTDVINFSLGNFVAPSVTNGTNCAGTTDGQTCVTYVGSPFTLQAKAGGSGTGGLATIVSLGLNGTVTDVATGQISNFTGSFSQTLDNLAPVQVQALFPSAASTNSIQTGFTGSFTATATPEPGSLFMAFGGLLVLAGAVRRRK